MTLIVSGKSHELRRDQVLRVSAGRRVRSKARRSSSSSARADRKTSRLFRHGLGTSTDAG